MELSATYLAACERRRQRWHATKARAKEKRLRNALEAKQIDTLAIVNAIRSVLGLAPIVSTKGRR